MGEGGEDHGGGADAGNGYPVGDYVAVAAHYVG